MPKKKPGGHSGDDVNNRFGARLRRLRELAGRSQSDLGDVLGVSFQQIQKYENGTTSISLNRMAELAESFGIPITKLLDGVEQPPTGLGFAESEQAPFDHEEDSLIGTGPMAKQKISLLQSFNKLESARVRRSLVTLVEAMVASNDED